MNSTLVTIAIPILSLLGWVAYTHPTEYSKYIFWPVTFISALTSGSIGAFNMGVLTLYNTASGSIADQAIRDAFAKQANAVLFDNNINLLIGAMQIWCVILVGLPVMNITSKRKSGDN